MTMFQKLMFALIFVKKDILLAIDNFIKESLGEKFVNIFPEDTYNLFQLTDI
jgi:hypothetical protein